MTGVSVTASVTLVSNAVRDAQLHQQRGAECGSVFRGGADPHGAGQTNGVVLNVLGNMTVDSLSRVDVSGKGYGSLSGPGKGRQLRVRQLRREAVMGAMGGTGLKGAPGGGLRLLDRARGCGQRGRAT